MTIYTHPVHYRACYAHEAEASIYIEGAGGGIWGEALIGYDIEPASRGSWDEPPHGDSIASFEILGWRTRGKGPWVKPEGLFLDLLIACVDFDWLIELARDSWHPDVPDRREDME